VVVDGRVVTGRASVDTSRVTGESIPLDVEPGDSVIAGSLVQVGYLEVEATRVGAESTFQRVLDLILEAQEAKPRVQEVLDRVGRVYTPLVLLLAAASLALTRDLHLSLTLLVVACPGALVMAAPVALMSGLAVAARHGVLLRRASAVESLARLDTLLFDKTGTLTEGRPRVSQVHGFGGWAPQQVLEVAAALEARSEHPLAPGGPGRRRSPPAVGGGGAGGSPRAGAPGPGCVPQAGLLAPPARSWWAAPGSWRKLRWRCPPRPRRSWRGKRRPAGARSWWRSRAGSSGSSPWRTPSAPRRPPRSPGSATWGSAGWPSSPATGPRRWRRWGGPWPWMRPGAVCSPRRKTRQWPAWSPGGTGWAMVGDGVE